MPEEPTQSTPAAQQEKEMREHEREARERSGAEHDEDPLGTPDGGANPAPPGNVQGGGLGGAS